jgi:uncharacterized protein
MDERLAMERARRFARAMDQNALPEEPLSLVEARVLACLLEKEVTTPEHYPLTLNSLTAACNQKSNRHPVMGLSDREVEVAVEGLRRRHLAMLFSGADARVPKYKHTLSNLYPMEAAERYALCELMLRGPQTAAELRSRCERLGFSGDHAVMEAALVALMNRPSGAIVTKLPRQPGKKESRYAHLLAGTPEIEAASAEPLRAEIALPQEAEERIAKLEAELAELREAFAQFRRQLE